MMSAPTIPRTATRARLAGDRHEPLRLRLKPKAATTGYVDGGWWPRSRDLAVELPGLLAVLAVRLGRIERVSYHLTDWPPTVRKISCGGSVVQLAGYRMQHADTVDVLGARQRVTLLVVPPEASAPTAQAALMTAGHRGNTDHVEALLRSVRITSQVLDSADTEAEAAQQRWELDGGSVSVGVAPTA
jgi:hypothetical protein